MINRSFMTEELKSLSASGIEESLMNFDYKLMIESPHLQQQSLNNKLCFKNYLEPASQLLNEICSSNNHEGIHIQAQCPNIYIQKLRGIYMLILRMGYELGKEKFSLSWNRLRHRYYCREKGDEVKKKYLAEFVSMISYSEGTKKVKQTINKYEVMDEILIDMLIEEINFLQGKTFDDNYNICLLLKEIGLNSTVISFYEFEVEQYVLLINQQMIKIKEAEKEFEYDLNSNEQLDQSNVFSVREDIFQKMENSFIKDLSEFTEENETVVEEKQEKVEFKNQQQNNKNAQKFTKNYFQGLENEITDILQNIKTRLTHIQSCQNINQIPTKPKISINLKTITDQNVRKRNYQMIERLSTSPQLKVGKMVSGEKKHYFGYLQPSKTVNFQYTNKQNFIK